MPAQLKNFLLTQFLKNGARLCAAYKQERMCVTTSISARWCCRREELVEGGILRPPASYGSGPFASHIVIYPKGYTKVKAEAEVKAETESESGSESYHLSEGTKGRSGRWQPRR